jgi:hypothetical protein
MMTDEPLLDAGTEYEYGECTFCRERLPVTLLIEIELDVPHRWRLACAACSEREQHRS